MISSEAEFEKLLAAAHQRRRQRLREEATPSAEQKQMSFEVVEKNTVKET
jgi:hypothetical protein